MNTQKRKFPQQPMSYLIGHKKLLQRYVLIAPVPAL